MSGYLVVMHVSTVMYAGLVCMVELGTSYTIPSGWLWWDLFSSNTLFIFLLPSHQPTMNAKHTLTSRTGMRMLATPIAMSWAACSRYNRTVKQMLILCSAGYIMWTYHSCCHKCKLLWQCWIVYLHCKTWVIYDQIGTLHACMYYHITAHQLQASSSAMTTTHYLKDDIQVRRI